MEQSTTLLLGLPGVAVSRVERHDDGTRSGGDTIMAATLYGVNDADLRALAHFLSRSGKAR